MLAPAYPNFGSFHRDTVLKVSLTSPRAGLGMGGALVIHSISSIACVPFSMLIFGVMCGWDPSQKTVGIS